MIFLVGRGRSGTSLLTKVLNALPGVYIGFESLFILNLWPQYKLGGWDGRRIERFGRDLFGDYSVRLWGIEPTGLVNHLKGCIGAESSYSDVCRETINYVGLKKSPHDSLLWLGIKDPHYSLYISFLVELFPRARFLFVIRDFRDNILSFQKMYFDLNDGVALAHRWNYFNQHVQKAVTAHPRRIHTVRYEDLITDPKDTVRAICGFLKIPYSEKFLDFYKQESSEGESVREFGKNLAGPILPENKDKWKTEMSAMDLEAANSICGSLGRIYGYETQENSREAVPWGRRWWGWLIFWAYTAIEWISFRIPYGITRGVRNFIRRPDVEAARRGTKS